MRFASAAMLPILILGCALSAFPQWAELPMTGSQPQTLVDRTIIAGQSGLGPLLTAEFVDRDANARQRRAVINIRTDGVALVDPVAADRAPNLSQGHVRYQVDSFPAASTTSLRIEINDLAPGEHHIHLALAGNDDKPMGHATMLNLHVPDSR